MPIWAHLACGGGVSRHTVRHVVVAGERSATRVSALVVDDEAPARNELSSELRNAFGVTHVGTARNSGEAMRHLQRRRFDVVFTEIMIGGLNGLEVASVLCQFASPPAVVFVTARDEYAVRAFEVGACDYLLKPVSRVRLGVALSRALERVPSLRALPSADGTGGDPSATIPVEDGGRTRFIARDDVRWVKAQGDHVRLHMSDGETHRIRMTLSRLEELWRDYGFIRIHRGCLVPLKHVTEFSAEGGNHTVTVAGLALPVSRRHVRDLRDRFSGAGWQ